MRRVLLQCCALRVCINLPCSGLQLVNVPMFFCLRRLVAAFILAYEYFVLSKVAEMETYAAILCITVSTLVAGWDSLNTEIFGYVITMLNNVLSAVSVIAVSHSVSSRYSATTAMRLLPLRRHAFSGATI